MKKNIHPQYGYVVYRDKGADTAFLTRSTAGSDKRIAWPDGNTYPVLDVDVSAASHPFWTGRQRLLDTEGRVEKFRAKYARAARRRSA
jgi:large subunit ribosomal protein L31